MVNSNENNDNFMKCLIANDEESQLLCLQMIFQSLDFKVKTSVNGYEAFELTNKQFSASGNQASNEFFQYYDLVVLDLTMPISDGYEACKNILNLYKDNQIFTQQRPKKNDSGVCSSQILLNQDLRPVMVACTSYVDD